MSGEWGPGGKPGHLGVRTWTEPSSSQHLFPVESRKCRQTPPDWGDFLDSSVGGRRSDNGLVQVLTAGGKLLVNVGGVGSWRQAWSSGCGGLEPTVRNRDPTVINNGLATEGSNKPPRIRRFGGDFWDSSVSGGGQRGGWVQVLTAGAPTDSFQITTADFANGCRDFAPGVSNLEAKGV